MGSRADLHTHSTFSDGVLTPAELIELAYRRGGGAMGRTHHETTEGVPEGAGAPAGGRPPPRAHPRELDALKNLLAHQKPAGMVGMEVYYQDYRPDEVEHLRALAERSGLIPLGGSDYHGLGGAQQRERGDETQGRHDVAGNSGGRRPGGLPSAQPRDRGRASADGRPVRVHRADSGRRRGDQAPALLAEGGRGGSPRPD